jgi:hypothetical protein
VIGFQPLINEFLITITNPDVSISIAPVLVLGADARHPNNLIADAIPVATDGDISISRLP